MYKSEAKAKELHELSIAKAKAYKELVEKLKIGTNQYPVHGRGIHPEELAFDREWGEKTKAILKKYEV